MNEENVGVKISMPLIDDIELQRIDTFYNDIVSKYTKAFVKEKDQVITQRLMMNLQQENERLKDKLKDIEKILKSNHDVEHIYCALSQYLDLFDYELDLEDYLKEN